MSMNESEWGCQKATAEGDFKRKKTIKMTFEHESEEWRISTPPLGFIFHLFIFISHNSVECPVFFFNLDKNFFNFLAFMCAANSAICT